MYHHQAKIISIQTVKSMHLKTSPVDTGRKLNVHKTFTRRPGRLLNVLCTFNLRPVSTGSSPVPNLKVNNYIV